MISKKFDITASLYFRIHNAELYGGAGSFGYAMVKYESCTAPENLDERTAEATRSYTARRAGVSVEDVEFIDRETYESETYDESDDDDFGLTEDLLGLSDEDDDFADDFYFGLIDGED